MSMQSRNEPEKGMTKGLFGETDRENGEYHFRNGYTQQVYSNAHFVPVDESTTTPKYYRPADRTQARSGQKASAEPRQKNRKRNTASFAVRRRSFFQSTWNFAHR